jgi:hypothetical protein
MARRGYLRRTDRASLRVEAADRPGCRNGVDVCTSTYRLTATFTEPWLWPIWHWMTSQRRKIDELHSVQFIAQPGELPSPTNCGPLLSLAVGQHLCRTRTVSRYGRRCRCWSLWPTYSSSSTQTCCERLGYMGPPPAAKLLEKARNAVTLRDSLALRDRFADIGSTLENARQALHVFLAELAKGIPTAEDRTLKRMLDSSKKVLAAACILAEVAGVEVQVSDHVTLSSKDGIVIEVDARPREGVLVDALVLEEAATEVEIQSRSAISQVATSRESIQDIIDRSLSDDSEQLKDTVDRGGSGS